jgi:hypothetical protein
MIQLAGSAKRSFFFPADFRAAMAFYAKMEQIIKHLPYISLDRIYSDTQFRVRYSSTELTVYNIKLFCNLEMSIDYDNALIKITTLPGKNNIKSKAGLHSSEGTASFISTSRFVSEGDHTRIYYHLKLNANLPKPLAFSLVPEKITNHIAQNIANRRIDEIADGFIASSLQEYQHYDL